MSRIGVDGEVRLYKIQQAAVRKVLEEHSRRTKNVADICLHLGVGFTVAISLLTQQPLGLAGVAIAHYLSKSVESALERIGTRRMRAAKKFYDNTILDFPSKRA